MQKETGQDANVARETIRAAEGEQVWVVLNHVKADKLEQHLHFVNDILLPAAEKIDPVAFRHTRFLHPVEQNEDGTYTSVFLMDPVIKGTDYSFEPLFKKAYGEDKVEEYVQLWDESLASPQVGYAVIQSES